MTKFILILLAALVGGCASLRKPDDVTSEKRLKHIRDAKSLKAAVKEIDLLSGDYVAQKRKLESDITGGGDAITLGGIGLGIAAVAKASTDVFTTIGTGVGILGVYNVRYNPNQQRQHYVGALDALRCIAGRANRLQVEEDTLQLLIGHDGVLAPSTVRDFSQTADQARGVRAFSERVTSTYNEVSRVHARLEDKLFSTVSTQTVAAIRDDLIKQSVDAQQRAKDVAGSTPAAPSSILKSTSVPASQVLSQVLRLLADATTYETDIAACTATYLN